MRWLSRLSLVFVLSSCVGTRPLAQRSHELAQYLAIPVPASAMPEFADYEGGPDKFVRLSWRMPTSDWQRMRTTPPFREIAFVPSSVAEDADFGPDDGEWRASHETSLCVGQVVLNEGRKLLIVGFASIPNKNKEARTGIRVYVLGVQGSPALDPVTQPSDHIGVCA